MQNEQKGIYLACKAKRNADAIQCRHGKLRCPMYWKISQRKLLLLKSPISQCNLLIPKA